MTVTAGIDVYADVADADAYFAARDVAAWPLATVAAREAALRRATAYLDGHYRWIGVLAASSQPLGWPRLSAWDAEGRPLDGIPARVKDACAELALVALTEELAPPADRGGRVLAERVGPVSLRYTADAPSGRSFPYVDLVLKGLFREDGAGIAVRRA
ncbi:MAG: hypothetical protein HQ481_20365 [Alphaproteobacteria bacterium]|nr:hypothetical protein [Alphaproteobacteria bacterium]